MELAYDTTNLLRPHQVVEAREELETLTATLNAPPHIRSRISDIGQMRQRRDNLGRELERSTPRAFSDDERDTAIAEFRALEKKIPEGMPSSEEMRRNPPGAVGKQLAWDQAQRKNVMRYKNLALRLHAGGDLPPDMKYVGDIANIERLRPLRTADQLSMDGAQIAKTTDIHIGADPVGTVVFSDQETTLLNELHPETAGTLAVLGNDDRAAIKAILSRITTARANDAVPHPEAAKAAKPTFQELGYNGMKKLAAANGIDCIGIKSADLIARLRAKHLIQ